MRQVISTGPLDGSAIYFHTPTVPSRQNFLYPLCLGDYICDGNYLVQRNRYDSFLIMYVESGEGFLEIENVRYHLKANDLAFIDCYTPHSYGANDFWHIEWIHFDGSSAREYYTLFRSHHSHVLSLPKSSARSALKPLRTLLSSFGSNTRLSEVWLSKYITDLLTYILDFSGGADAGSLAPGIAEQVLHYIQMNFQQPLTIEDLAKRLSLNPSYLIRRFKKETGMSPYQYLTSLRIERAQYELKTTSRSIKEIGFSCGYQSENSFCITFRKETGMTPTEFRRGG